MPKKTRQDTTAARSERNEDESGWADGPSSGSAAGSTIDLHRGQAAVFGEALEWPRVEAIPEQNDDIDCEC